MAKHDYYVDNRCMFCGEKAREEFFSGSHETYTTCDCVARKEFNKASDKLNALTLEVEKKLGLHRAKRDLKHAEIRVVQLKAALKRGGV